MNFLKSKKGFTLVEIIVVLVIIAILAAIALPALTGYIDDAKAKVSISEGRTVLVAAQTISSELSGFGVVDDFIEEYLTAGTKNSGGKFPTGYNTTIIGLTGMKEQNKNSGKVLLASATVEDGSVNKFTYVAYNAQTVTYDRATDSLTITK